MKNRIVRLGDFAETTSGGTPNRGNKAFYNGDIPWVKSGELPDGEITWVEEKISKEGLQNSNAKLLEAGTLLIAMYGATVGRLGILTFPAATNQAVCAITPSKEINQDYLFYWFLSYRNMLLKASFGGAQPNISQTLIRDLELPLPPIREQGKIATKLKSQLAEVEKARKAVELQLREVKLIRNRFYQKAIGGLVDAKRIPLGNLINGIETGKSLQTTELIAKESELGILKVSAISWNKFQPNEAKAIDSSYNPSDKHRIKKGDLIISRANTIELVGAVVLVEKDYPNRLLSDKTLRLLVDTGQVLPEFILHILKLPEARNHIESNATGTSDSMRNISQDTICSIPIPFVSKSEQRKIVELLESANDLINSINMASGRMIKDLETLPKKLLSTAFEIS